MQLFKVKQKFNRTQIPDEQIEEVVKQQIRDSGVTVQKGSQIAITAGSRGIANIHRIVKATVEIVKEMGGNPFIVPAMGSHGGAAAEGQQEGQLAWPSNQLLCALKWASRGRMVQHICGQHEHPLTRPEPPTRPNLHCCDEPGLAQPDALCPEAPQARQ